MEGDWSARGKTKESQANVLEHPLVKLCDNALVARIVRQVDLLTGPVQPHTRVATMVVQLAAELSLRRQLRPDRDAVLPMNESCLGLPKNAPHGKIGGGKGEGVRRGTRQCSATQLSSQCSPSVLSEAAGTGHRCATHTHRQTAQSAEPVAATTVRLWRELRLVLRSWAGGATHTEVRLCRSQLAA